LFHKTCRCTRLGTLRKGKGRRGEEDGEGKRMGKEEDGEERGWGDAQPSSRRDKISKQGVSVQQSQHLPRWENGENLL